MDILKYILRNIFRSKRITKKRLRVFGLSVINALIAKNTEGQYDTLIAALQAIFADLNQYVVGQDTHLAQQKGRTSFLDGIVTLFEQKIHRDYMVISSKFYKDKPEYLEFFPEGLTEFNKISREDFELLISRIIEGLTTYQGGVLTAQMVTDYTTIKTNYLNGLSSQTAKKVTVKSDKDLGNIARVAFEDQLYFTLLTLAALNFQNPQVVREFFDTSILFPHTHKPMEDNTDDEFSVVVAPEEVKDSGLTNIVGKTARFINNSNGIAQIGTTASLDDMEAKPTFITVLPDDEAEVEIATLHNPTDPFLIIRNLSTTDELELIIEWI